MVFLLSIWCLYILVNYYFRVYFNLKVILSPVIKPLPITVLLQKLYGDLNIWIRVNTSITFDILNLFHAIQIYNVLYVQSQPAVQLAMRGEENS